nr:MAG TPA: hypothetical protein [Crassvirales sp.]
MSKTFKSTNTNRTFSSIKSILFGFSSNLIKLFLRSISLL